jgi:hypothetical protein
VKLMSKPKVTPAPPGPQEEQAPRTIPLSEISITWPKRNDFEGDDERPAEARGAYVKAVGDKTAPTAEAAR